MSKPVIVYRELLLPRSEVFITSQASALRAYDPHFVGLRRTDDPFPYAHTLLLGPHPNRASVGIARLRGRPPRSATRRVGERAPALVHAHFGPDGLLASGLARQLGVPLVVTFHGFDVFTDDAELQRLGFTARLYTRRRSVLATRGARFIAVSDAVERALLRLGFPADRVVRHYIGVDVDAFEPRPQEARDTDVLFVGRLVESKGLRYLIDALAIVQLHWPDVRLVVIGDGPEGPGLRRLASQALRNVEFLGSQPHDVVRAAMGRARVLCVPSVPMPSGYVEALGMVFVEAAASGLPAVAFSTGGVAEVIDHGNTGFLAPPRDTAQLATHIGDLLSDNALWTRMSGAGMARARARFDLATQTAALEALYDEVTANAPAGATER